MFALILALLFQMRPGVRLLLLFSAVLLSQFSISVLNDWADRDADALANRGRPVATGRISAGLALALAAGFAVLSLAATAPFGIVAVLLLLLGLLAGWSYDLVFKPTPLSFISFAIAFPLLVIWVAQVAGRPLHRLPIFLIGGVVLAVAVHLADSIPDRTLDGRAGLRTLPVVWPFPLAELAAGSLLLVGVVVMEVGVWQSGRFTWPMLFPLVLGALFFVNALNRGTANDITRQQFAKWTLVIDAAFCGLILSLVTAYG